MNYIVFDLEATCWEQEMPTYVQEVIEIGAVKLDEYAQQQDTFCRFVKPVFHPYLSNFCKQLTTIRQEDVDRAKDFERVIEEFKEWIGLYDDEEYLLCSWGYFDRNLLEKNCQVHKLEKDWLEHHISLKHQYQKIRKITHPIGLKTALQAEGYEFEGTPHRGIDDAQNLAKIFKNRLDEWVW